MVFGLKEGGGGGEKLPAGHARYFSNSITSSIQAFASPSKH